MDNRQQQCIDTRKLSEEEKTARLAFGAEIIQMLGNFAMPIINSNKSLYLTITALIHQIENYYTRLAAEEQLISSRTLYSLILENLKNGSTARYRKLLYAVLLLFIERFALDQSEILKEKQVAEQAKKTLLDLYQQWLISNKASEADWKTLVELEKCFANYAAPSKPKHLPYVNRTNLDDFSIQEIGKITNEHIAWILDADSLPPEQKQPMQRMDQDEVRIATIITAKEEELKKIRAANHDPFSIAATIIIEHRATSLIKKELNVFSDKIKRYYDWVKNSADKFNWDISDLDKLIYIDADAEVFVETHIRQINKIESILFQLENRLRSQFSQEKQKYQQSKNKHDAVVIEQLDLYLLLIQRVHDLREPLRNIAEIYCQKSPTISGIGKVTLAITSRILNPSANDDRKNIRSTQNEYLKLAHETERDKYVKNKVDIVRLTIAKLTDYEIGRKKSLNFLRRFNDTRLKQVTRLLSGCSTFIDDKNIKRVLDELEKIKKEIENEYKVRQATNSDLYNIVVWGINNLNQINVDELNDTAHQSNHKDKLAMVTRTDMTGMLGRSHSQEMLDKISFYKTARNNSAIAKFKNSLAEININKPLGDFDEISADYLGKLNDTLFSKLDACNGTELLNLLNSQVLLEYQQLFKKYEEDPFAQIQEKRFYQALENKLFNQLDECSPKDLLNLLNSPILLKYQQLFKKFKNQPFAPIQEKKFYEALENKLHTLFFYLSAEDYIEKCDDCSDENIPQDDEKASLDWLPGKANIQRGLRRLTSIAFIKNAFEDSPEFLQKFEKCLEKETIKIIKNEADHLASKDALTTSSLDSFNQFAIYLKKPSFLLEFRQKKYPSINSIFLSETIVPVYLRHLTLLSTTTDLNLIERAQETFALDLTTMNRVQPIKQKHLIDQIKYRYAYLLFSEGKLSFAEVNSKMNQYLAADISALPSAYCHALSDFFNIYNAKKDDEKPEYERTRNCNHPNLIYNNSTEADIEANITKAKYLLNCYPQFQIHDSRNKLFLNFIKSYINFLITQNRVNELVNLDNYLQTTYKTIIPRQEFLAIIYKNISQRNNKTIIQEIVNKIDGFNHSITNVPENIPAIIANTILINSTKQQSAEVITKLLGDINNNLTIYSSPHALFDNYDNLLLANYNKEKIAVSKEKKNIWKSLFAKSIQEVTHSATDNTQLLAQLHLIAYAYCDKEDQQQYENLISANNEIQSTSEKILDTNSDFYGLINWTNHSLTKNKESVKQFSDCYHTCDGVHKKRVEESLFKFFEMINSMGQELNADYAALIEHGLINNDYSKNPNDYACLLLRMMKVYSKLKSCFSQDIQEKIDNILSNARNFSENQILPFLHPTSHFFRGSAEENHANNLSNKERALSERFLLINSLFLEPRKVNGRLQSVYSAYVLPYANPTCAKIATDTTLPFRYNAFEQFIAFAKYFPACLGLGTAVFSTNRRKKSLDFTTACRKYHVNEPYDIRMMTLYHGWLLEMQAFIVQVIDQVLAELNAEQAFLGKRYAIPDFNHAGNDYTKTINFLLNEYKDDPKIIAFCHLLARAKDGLENRATLENWLEQIPHPATDEIKQSFFQFYKESKHDFANVELQFFAARVQPLLDKFNKLNTIKWLTDVAYSKACDITAMPSLDLIKQCYLYELLEYATIDENALSVAEVINLAQEELQCLLEKTTNFDAAHLKNYIEQYKRSIPGVNKITEILQNLASSEKIEQLTLLLPKDGLVLNAQSKTILKNNIESARQNQPWAENLLIQLDNLIQHIPTLTEFGSIKQTSQHSIALEINSLMKKATHIDLVYNQDQRIAKKIADQNYPDGLISELQTGIRDYLQKNHKKIPSTAANLGTIKINQEDFDTAWTFEALPSLVKQALIIKTRTCKTDNVCFKAKTCELIFAFTTLLQQKLPNQSTATKVTSLLELKYFLLAQKADLVKNHIDSRDFNNLLNITLAKCDAILESLPDSSNEALGIKLVLLEKAIYKTEDDINKINEFEFGDDSTNFSPMITIIKSALIDCLNIPWKNYSTAQKNIFFAQLNNMIHAKELDLPSHFIEDICSNNQSGSALHVLEKLNRELFFKSSLSLKQENIDTFLSIVKQFEPLTPNEMSLLQSTALIHHTDLAKIISLCELFNNSQVTILQTFKQELVRKFSDQIKTYFKRDDGTSLLFKKLIQFNNSFVKNPIKLFDQLERSINDWILKNPSKETLEKVCSTWPDANFNRAPSIKSSLVKILDDCRAKDDSFDNTLLDLPKNSLLDDIRNTPYFAPLPNYIDQRSSPKLKI